MGRVTFEIIANGRDDPPRMSESSDPDKPSDTSESGEIENPILP